MTEPGEFDLDGAAPLARSRRSDKRIAETLRMWRGPETGYVQKEFREAPPGVIGYDLETADPTLLDRGSAWAFSGVGDILGVAVAWEGFRAYYPIGHREGNVDREQTYNWVTHHLKRPDVKFACANAAYDIGWTRREMGLYPAGGSVDVQFMVALLDENRRTYKLDEIADTYLGERKKTDVIREVMKTFRFTYSDVMGNLKHLRAASVGVYAEQDADLTYRLYHTLMPKILDEGLLRVHELESALIEMSVEMKRRGIRVDVDKAAKLANEISGTRIPELQARIKRSTLIDVSPWDAVSLEAALNACGIVPGRTRTGEPQIDKESLAAWAKSEPVAGMILDLRKASKIENTFLRGHVLGHEHNGRIHADLNQLKSERDEGGGYGTVSGRYSCVRGDTRIRTQRGLVPITEVRVGDAVWTHQQRFRRVLRVLDQGVQATVSVALSNGNILNCTKSHRLLASDGAWSTVGEIQERLKDVGPKIGVEKIDAGAACQVYDLTVEEDESYLSEGVFSHNCTAPNLQQLPARDPEWGPLIRSLFLPEEGEMIASADYCHDEQTDILTENGWVLFSLLQDEKVAQWENGIISFVAPTAKFVGEHKRRLLLHYKGSHGVDAMVTQDHRMLVLGVKNMKSEVIRAADVSTAKGKYAVWNAGLLLDGQEENPALIQLVVAAQADAAVRPARRLHTGRRLRFYLKKDRKVARLRNILKALRVDYKLHYPPSKPGFTSISFEAPAGLWDYLTEEKDFISAKIMGLSLELRRLFVAEVKYWDGNERPSRAKKAGRWEGWGYTTTRSVNADTLQAVAAISGLRANAYTSLPAQVGGGALSRQLRHQITFSDSDRTWLMPGMGPEPTPHHGRVYCVTVPSGFIITRRNGKVLVSGNSSQEPRLAVHFAYLSGLRGAQEAVDKFKTDPRTDYHGMVAKMANIPRPHAKGINLSLAYGAGGAKIARSLGLPTRWKVISPKGEWSDIEPDQIDEMRRRRMQCVELAGPEAKDIIDRWEKGAPFLRGLYNLAKTTAETRGYIKTILGRRCRFGVSGAQRNFLQEEFTHTHKALNKLCQGSAADQTKQGMLNLYQMGVVPLLTVHDELIFSVKSEREARLHADVMEQAIPLEVPSVVDVHCGATWGDVEK